MATIRTERLLLRPARHDDAEAMHEVLSHPTAMLYWSSLPHATLDETREWIASMVEAPPDESLDFIIELDGRLIGKAGCWRLPEIGYILHPDHWGRGYAREALGAVIPAIFGRFPIPELTADVDPLNRASLRLLERLGFQRTGSARNTWLIGDVWHDSIYLALKRP